MGKQYVIGVDGGNSKTDYFLFNIEGKLVSYLRGATCSHEQMEDGYEGTYREIKSCLDKLLSYQDIGIEEVVSGAFGLAGLDIPRQKEELEAVIHHIGLTHFVVDNDGYLGLKAGSEKGRGICSINGTGTVTVGIDSKGNRLQVGGMGYISGDDAGGAFITRLLFREIYSILYRCGKSSELVEAVMKLLEVRDKLLYIETITEQYSKGLNHTPFITLVFEYAEKGDELANHIIDMVAKALADSTVGCISNLEFAQDEVVDIILAGSIWVKPLTNILIERYKEYVKRMRATPCNYSVLQVPPGIGAVLWALELAHGKALSDALHRQIIKDMEALYR